jgi:hypothetical protein
MDMTLELLMPKCTTQAIEQELSRLEGSGFVCAVAYLKAELARRKGSARNPGAEVKNDTPRHKAWREASARYRDKQKTEPARYTDNEDISTA